ncbi:MAG TPA: penicillin-binding protein 2 [Gemmatimonadales bacterium]|jgi:penicillin-binding protein 2|nr:penicillin-binding protein 2 [Gemmatimonadales bacterium]
MTGSDSYRLGERARAARWIIVGAFLVLLGAFFRTQIIQHEKFQLKAETNRLRPIPLTAPRGTIYDRHGEIIAENVPGYSVKLLAPSADSLKAVLTRVREVVPLDSAAIAEVLRRFQTARYQPVVVFGDATFETVSRLEEHRVALPGLVIQAEPKRLYPARSAVAHLVGYVGEVTDADLESDRYEGLEPGAIVGKAGLEQEYDDSLRGTVGVRYIEVNARGRLVREEASSASLPPTPGRPIETTIDLDLQRFIDSIWPAGVRGAMVAMTPSGEVRALYSAPSFDPNAFVGGITPQLWRALNTDEAHPLLNRALQARYPPASPFKLAIAAMALKRGLIGLDSHMPVPCRGGLRMGNRVFRCWKKEGHGSLDLIGAIAASCDVYFYQVGLRLGLDAIIEDGVLMGFKDKAGIDLRNEINPIYPSSTAYFDRLYGAKRWSPAATTLNFSIGQGENTQTLINMVHFYAGLAGSGEEVSPFLVRPRSDAKGRPLGLGTDVLEGLRHALIAVVERGTAAASRHEDLQVAGKTGTAQNPHGKDHGWFIGFAPADKPELVVGGIMEFAEHGTVVAPYVVAALRRYVLGPDTSAKAAVKLRVIVPDDSAPRALELDPDSAAVQAAAESLRTEGEKPRP